jgi:hypothetical protein
MDAARHTPPRCAPASAAGSVLRLTEGERDRIRLAALGFIGERYRLTPLQLAELASIPVRWRRGSGSSAYYTRRAHGFDRPHILLRVPRGASARWHTYRRARARFGTPPGGIELDVRVLAGAVLVHELTHAVQHGAAGEARRRFSEVETTENEIEFVRRHAPAAFAQLVPVLRRKRAGAASRSAARGSLQSRTPRGLAALRAIVLRTAGALADLVRVVPGAVPSPPPRPRRGRSPMPTGS